MKLVCRKQDGGCLVELTKMEHKALYRLQMSVEGKRTRQLDDVLYDREWDTFQRDISMESIFDAITNWTNHKFLINEMREHLGKLESILNPVIVEESQK